METLILVVFFLVPHCMSLGLEIFKTLDLGTWQNRLEITVASLLGSTTCIYTSRQKGEKIVGLQYDILFL